MTHAIAIAKTSEIAPGQIKTFSVDGHRILVANWQGTFFATQDLCTHDNGTLGDGELVDGQVECPRHGGRFDVHTGAVTALPPLFPIKTYPVEIKEDQVFVALE